MLKGDLASGWRCYEWRKLKEEPVGNRAYAQPLWTGRACFWQDDPGALGTGLGDTLQFCRYVPALEQRGAKVLLRTEVLRRLMRSLSPSIDLSMKAISAWSSISLSIAEPAAGIQDGSGDDPQPGPYLDVEASLVDAGGGRSAAMASRSASAGKVHVEGDAGRSFRWRHSIRFPAAGGSADQPA